MNGTGRLITVATAEGVIASQSRSSGREPGLGLAEYHDTLNDQPLTAPTGFDLLQVMDGAGQPLMTKQRLQDLTDNGELAGTQSGQSMRPPWNPEEFDTVHFDLGHMPADKLERAREIIIRELTRPNISYEKGKGQGKSNQQINFTGRRAVLAWPIHTNQEAPPHFQVFAHVYAVDGNKKITPKCTIRDSAVKDGVVAQINTALAHAGLPTVNIAAVRQGMENAETKRAGFDAEHNEELREALARGELPEIDQAKLPDLAPSAKQDMMRVAAQQAESEAAKLFQQAQVALQRAKTYTQAQAAIVAEQQLTQRLDALAHEVKTLREESEAQAQAAAAALAEAQAKAQALAEQNEGLAATVGETNSKLAEVNETLLSREQDLDAAESMISDLDAQAKQAAERAEALAAEREALAVRVAEEEGNARTAAARAEEEAAQRAQDAQAHAEALAQAQTAAATAQGQVKELAQELDSTRGQVRTLAGERDDFKAQAEQADRAHQRSEAQRATEQREHAEQVARLEDERNTAKRHVREALAEKVKAEGQVDRLRAELDNRPTAQALAEAQAKARAEAEARAQAEAERQAMAEQLANMRQQLAQAQAAGAQAKAELAQRPTVEDLAEVTAQRDKAAALVVRYRALVEEQKPEGPSNDDEPGNKGPGSRGPGAR